MTRPDLNLLVALDVLLEAGSVAGAARRMRLSPSAMSRTLARLREATGDPLLVRAGRGLVPTPRALELRERVGKLVQEAEAALRPDQEINVAELARTFTLRTSDGFVDTFGPGLIEMVGEEAPQVRLRFIQKLDKDSGPLREGAVDLETGVVGGATGPEVRAQALFRDRFIGVVRCGHPLSEGPVSAAGYAGGRHVGVSRGKLSGGPVDEALGLLGLQREIVVTVGGYAAALALARSSDLIASVPERHTGGLRAGLHSFPLPFPAPEVTISLLWHPRLDADPAHRWLRRCVRDACAKQLAQPLLLSPAGAPSARETWDTVPNAPGPENTVRFRHRWGWSVGGAMVDRRKRLTFWGADEDDDSLPRSVIEGRKTVTSDTVDDYFKPYGEYGDGSYTPGDIIEVYDLKRRLRCIIKATKVYVIRFGDVPEEVWRGETFSSAEEFRECHVRCMPHLDLHDDVEFVTLHFDLVEVIAP